MRYSVLDGSCRELFVDWAEVARDNVAILRLDAGRHPDDPLLVDLVGELSVKSPEFRRWWAHQNVRERTDGTKRYYHPLVGDLNRHDFDADRAVQRTATKKRKTGAPL